MSNIRLIKQPGYMRDLFFIFFLYFNKEYCFENFTLKKRKAEDITFYKEILNEFSPISDDLYVFFHVHQNGRCFFTCSYFDPYIRHLISDYNLDFIMNEMADQKKFIKKVIEFYFYELSDEEVQSCLDSEAQIFKVIKDSNYSDTDKLRLYEFFLNPTIHIQKLFGELALKEAKLSSFYEKNYSTIFEIFNQLNLEIIIKQIEPLKDYNYLMERKPDVFLTFCLINRGIIYVASLKENVVFVLGDKYKFGIDEAKKTNDLYKLDTFGLALSEKNRVSILNYMTEKGVVTCKELEQRFNFSGSTAYHHLSTLFRLGIINTKYEGKNVYYSINSKYFDTIIKKLYRYSSMENREKK